MMRLKLDMRDTQEIPVATYCMHAAWLSTCSYYVVHIPLTCSSTASKLDKQETLNLTDNMLFGPVQQDLIVSQGTTINWFFKRRKSAQKAVKFHMWA